MRLHRVPLVAIAISIHRVSYNISCTRKSAISQYKHIASNWLYWRSGNENHITDVRPKFAMELCCSICFLTPVMVVQQGKDTCEMMTFVCSVSMMHEDMGDLTSRAAARTTRHAVYPSEIIKYRYTFSKSSFERIILANTIEMGTALLCAPTYTHSRILGVGPRRYVSAKFI